MRKTKSEIKHMAGVIAQKKGSYMFNIKEISEILGVSRDTARTLLSDIPFANVGCAKKYFIEDVLLKIYN